MSVTFSREERKILKQIASFYNATVVFDNNIEGGRCSRKTIFIGNTYTKRRLFSLFFHELAHVVNYQTNKYPLYHKNYGGLRDSFDSYDMFVHYALQAEVYTEKVGKRLMKEWFPTMKYEGYYKNTKLCKEFLYGYYL